MPFYPDSESNKPKFPRPENIKDAFYIAKGTALGIGDGIRNEKAQEALNDIKKETTGIVNLYKKELVIGLVALVGLRVYKRKVSKAAVKQVLKTLEKVGQNANNPNLFEILEDLRAAPGTACIPDGGGMVHLLKGKDAIVTIFGDFENMKPDELWSKVANVLNLGINTSSR